MAFTKSVCLPCDRYLKGFADPDYMQETGRAGRDGKLATCVLYYGYQDAVKMRHMLQESAKENNTPPEQQRRNTESVNTMVKDPVP